MSYHIRVVLCGKRGARPYENLQKRYARSWHKFPRTPHPPQGYKGVRFRRWKRNLLGINLKRMALGFFSQRRGADTTTTSCPKPCERDFNETPEAAAWQMLLAVEKHKGPLLNSYMRKLKKLGQQNGKGHCYSGR